MSEPSLPPSPSLKPRLALALLAAFAFGMMAGGAVVRFVAPFQSSPFSHEKKHRMPPHDFPPGHPPDDMPRHLADKLSEELNLEESLREPVRQIFREGFEASEPIRQRAGEEMKVVFDRQNQKLVELLSPEQRVRFEALQKEWEKRRGPPGPPPPPPPQQRR